MFGGLIIFVIWNLMKGEFKLDCLGLDGIGLDTNIVLVKLKEVAQRSKMGGNEGIHLGLKK
jgi:hypothetical protein